MAQDYDFLMNYVSNLATGSETPDEAPLDDDSDLYDVQSDDDIVADPDNGGYGFDEDYDLNQEYTEEGEDGGINFGYPGSRNEGNAPAPGNLGSSIADIESGGKYSATNKHSSAVGKYQFLWSDWGESIEKVTGVKSKEEFLKSPKAQETYYAWYEKNYLMPQVQKLKKFNKAGLTDQQIAKLVHFRGAGGAKKYLQGQMKDKPEQYNIPISQYIGTKQTGGAAYPLAQRQADSLLLYNEGRKEHRMIENARLHGDENNYAGNNALRRYIDNNTAEEAAFNRLDRYNGKPPGVIVGSYDFKSGEIGTNGEPYRYNVNDIFYQKPSSVSNRKPLRVPNIKPVNVQRANIGNRYSIPEPGMTMGQLAGQEKTNFSFSGRDENGNQVTRYFPDLESWKRATEMAGYADRNITNNGNEAHATGFTFRTGGVAMTPMQQHIGLNDEHYDSMFFPMHGENEFRGLDDGTPVYLEDETGKKKVLKGKKHKTKMKGKVYEKRLK